MSVPFEIQDVDPELNAEVLTLFPKRKDGFVHAGSKKYLLYSKYRKEAVHYYNMELRPDDVWIISFPRSGSTWTQELVWLINNDLDYETALSKKLITRSPFLEYSFVLPDDFIAEMMEKHKNDPSKLDLLRENFRPAYETLPKMKSPRHVKTHFSLSLLPPKLLDTCKVIYVARNPKDVAVSYFHLHRLKGDIDMEADFPQYWDIFQRDLLTWAPFWSHVEESWRLKEHKNMLFLFYEDMKKDLPAAIRKTAAFLGKSYTDEQVIKLVDHLHIDNFRKQPALQQLMNCVNGMKKNDAPGFYRKGESGAWRSMFPPELNAKADEWIREHEKHTDLRFQF